MLVQVRWYQQKLLQFLAHVDKLKTHKLSSLEGQGFLYEENIEHSSYLTCILVVNGKIRMAICNGNPDRANTLYFATSGTALADIID